MSDYDAVLLVSFGGPEGPDDVLPFLRNVVRGRNVPEARLVEVAKHYDHFGGKSPINDQCRALLQALSAEFETQGVSLPLYWGNRNWHPMLADTVAQMKSDGVKRALAFVTSAYSSYSSCRQYLNNIDQARADSGPDAPVIDKLRVFYNHPGFIKANADSVKASLAKLPGAERLVFTAHSIPESMAKGCDYVDQLNEACRLVADAVGHQHWDLVYQSRSGPPSVPWLEPDINDHFRALCDKGVRSVVVSPVGFVSDHVEVIWDLDHEASDTAKECGIAYERAGTASLHPAFVSMVAELVLERLGQAEPRALGPHGVRRQPCAPDCCAPASRGL